MKENGSKSNEATIDHPQENCMKVYITRILLHKFVNITSSNVVLFEIISYQECGGG